jgi:anthranilate 1,2-dioxygenase small subunit
MSAVTSQRPSPPAFAAGMPTSDLKTAIEDLYTRYAECIADDQLEEWPNFFTDECVYQITPRVNWDRGLPVSIMLSESRGGLVDRVTAIRNTMVFAPRTVLPAFSGIRITSCAGDVFAARSTFVVYQTQQDGVTTLLMAGRSFDTILNRDDDMRFVKRIVVYENSLLPATVVYPV